MPDRPTATLRIEPDMLPALIEAYATALDRLKPMRQTLQSRGRVPRPWTDDPVAEQIATNFNDHAVDGPRSAYTMIHLYEQELVRVHKTLVEMDAAYRGVEDDNTTRLGRL